MSAAPAGLVAAVSQPGKCEREVHVGKRKHVKHSWRLHTKGVELTTTLLDSKSSHRGKNKAMAYVENSEKALSLKGAEKAEEVLTNTRDRFLKAQKQKLGGSVSSSSSSSGRRRKADLDVACPIVTALRGGWKTRSGATSTFPSNEEVEVDWRMQPADTFVASLNGMSTGDVLDLLASKGATFENDVRAKIRDLKVKASVGVSLKRAIEQAQKQNGTNEGSRTWQTLLTAAAFQEGDHGEASTISTKRKAAALGIHQESTTTRITGTEWQAGDQAHAETLLEEIGREEKPATFARS